MHYLANSCMNLATILEEMQLVSIREKGDYIEEKAGRGWVGAISKFL